MLNKLKTAWQNRDSMGDTSLERQQLEFLPAALEIQERPPHPAGRITAGLLILLFTIAVVWACFGEVNIVAVAEGKIVPQGQVKIIQPYERGVVAEILVSDGQLVSAGDPLVILDRSQTGPEQLRLEQGNRQNRLNATRVSQFLIQVRESTDGHDIPALNKGDRFIYSVSV